MEYCQHDPVPEVYKLWTAVSALAGAVQHKVWHTNDGSMFEYPNLYILLVGEVNSGKSTAARHAVAMLQNVKGFKKAPAKLTEASLIDELIDAGRENSFTFCGLTYRNGSIYIYASEASKTFQGMGRDNRIVNTITDYYNTMDHNFWSQKPFDAKRTKSHGLQEIHNPCVNILACSTVDWLMNRVLTEDDIKGGTGSRFIFAANDSPMRHRKAELDRKGERNALFGQLVADLREISELSGNMIASEEFREQHFAYKLEHEKLLSKLRETDEIMFFCLHRKASTLVLRLAMLLALDEGDCVINDRTEALQLRHITKAWEMLTRLEQKLPDVLAEYGVSEDTAPTHKVLSHIRRNKLTEFSRQYLIETFERNFRPRQIDMIIGDLMQLKKITVDFEKSSLGNRVFRVL
jgi:hypothetical protein